MTKASTVLDCMVSDLRRDVSRLLDEASKKAAHVEHLHSRGQTPMVASDYPAREWAAIAERQQVIDCLIEAKRQVEMKRRRR